jgi:ribosomal protein L12E/L44/L45/RPP1/RPP2
MEQINEAYEFIKGVFRDNADEVLRKVYVNPTAAAAPAAAAAAATPTPASESKATKAKKPAGWIAHPCPRNIVKLNADESE